MAVRSTTIEIMGLAWRGITGASLIAAYLISTQYPSTSRLTWFLVNFLAALTAQFLCWAAWRVVFWPKFFSPLIGLPEPKGNSFFNGQWHRIRKQPSGTPMVEWINTIPNDGLITYKGLFNGERVLPVSAKALAEVLVTKNYEFQKPMMVRTGLGRILGMGLLVAEGDEHKVQRRTVLPAFAFRHVKDLYSTFWDIAREGVTAMTDKVLVDAAESPAFEGEKLAPNTAIVEISNWASRMTLDIIGVAGLGRNFNAIQDPNNELIRTYRALLAPSRQAVFLDIARLLLPGWLCDILPLQRNITVSHAAAFIRKTCRDLIHEKRAKLANNKLDDLDILSVSIESGGFTDDQLVDQLMTFLAAGHETTASAMTWAIYMMCLHPEVQSRLREEVRSHLPSPNDKDATVTSQQIDHLPYLQAVCSEVLRYYPPAPLTLREAVHDTTILDHPIPAGTRVMIIPAAVNKSKELWGEDADKFNPERWLPRIEGDKNAASGHASSNYAFLTFLHGPRSCIGQAFAKAEFACLLAAWVGRFSFEIRDRELLDESKMDIKGGITSRPTKGLHVKVTALEGW